MHTASLKINNRLIVFSFETKKISNRKAEQKEEQNAKNVLYNS